LSTDFEENLRVKDKTRLAGNGRSPWQGMQCSISCSDLSTKPWSGV